MGIVPAAVAPEESADPNGAFAEEAEEVDETASFRALPGGDYLVDLHGLPVEVAKIAVQVALEDLLIRPPKRHASAQPGTGDLIIVTGRGSHSPGGVALVRPAVLAYLRDDLR